LSVVLTLLLVLSPLGCGSSASRDRPGKPYSSKEVRAAFAKQQLSLETFGVPEGGPVGQVLEISFSSPANTPTQDEIQFFVDVYRTSAAARSAERFFRESGFTAGRFVPPGDGVFLRTRNVLLRYDPLRGPETSLRRARAALADLNGDDG